MKMAVLQRLSRTCGLKSLYRQIIPALSQRYYSITNEDKIYELRTYSIKPDNFKTFLALSDQWFHLRTKHSKLIGYWISELGGINDVVHIWEYDSLGHRAQVRQALASDPVWIENYFSKILPFFLKQDNAVMKCVPGTTITEPPGKGVYELRSYAAQNVPLDTLSRQLSQTNITGGSVLGSFYNMIGITNIGHQLCYYPDIDNILPNKAETKTSNDDQPQIYWFQSRVLLPASFSPMQ